MCSTNVPENFILFVPAIGPILSSQQMALQTLSISAMAELHVFESCSAHDEVFSTLPILLFRFLFFYYRHNLSSIILQLIGHF